MENQQILIHPKLQICKELRTCYSVVRRSWSIDLSSKPPQSRTCQLNFQATMHMTLPICSPLPVVQSSTYSGSLLPWNSFHILYNSIYLCLHIWCIHVNVRLSPSSAKHPRFFVLNYVSLLICLSSPTQIAPHEVIILHEKEKYCKLKWKKRVANWFKDVQRWKVVKDFSNSFAKKKSLQMAVLGLPTNWQLEALLPLRLSPLRTKQTFFHKLEKSKKSFKSFKSFPKFLSKNNANCKLGFNDWMIHS